MRIEKVVNRHRRLIALFLICLILYAAYLNLPTLSVVPGPEGVSASLYSVVANGGIRVGGTAKTLSFCLGVHSVVGKATPMTWISFADYSERDFWGAELKRRIGYQWVRPDPKTPVIQAVIIDRNTGQVLEGVNLQIRFKPVTMDDVNRHGDPLGRNPTQIDWYSFESGKTETATSVTWKHYEVYIVPVDIVVELSVRPVNDLCVGDFQNLDLWFVIDTVVWANAFTPNQYALLRQAPPEGVKVTAYNFRGGFPIWAWVGAWDPWVVTGRDGNPDKFYDPADLTPGERSELEQHLQIMPSFKGSEVTLYTKPGYVYDRLFSSDIVKNPDRLRSAIESQIPGLPDPRFAQTVYVPVTLINYGAMKREEGWGWWYQHKEYYPTSYLRIRCLYAIYGEWVYMWTKQEAEKFNYQWENRTSEITGDRSLWDKFLGAFSGIGQWLSNPFNVMGLFGFMAIAAVILITVLNPGVWTALAVALRRGRRE